MKQKENNTMDKLHYEARIVSAILCTLTGFILLLLGILAMID